MINRIRNERASSTIEYVIIFPIVLLIVMLLILLGFIMLDKAVIDSATERGAIKVQKMMVDPQYELAAQDNLSVVEKNILFHKDNYTDLQPYRYLFGVKVDIDRMKELIKTEVTNQTILPDDNLTVAITIDQSIINNQVEVIVTKKINMPSLFGVEISDIEIKSRSLKVANSSTEFVRNLDLARDVIEATGIFDKMFDAVKQLKEEFYTVEN